jgi:PilZ domain-containing protein
MPAHVMDDRREFQRLRLSKPILATMGENNALILDVGIGGAFLEHYGKAESGDRFPLRFRWQGDEIDLVCEVARSEIVRAPGGDGASSVSHSGVRFVDAGPGSTARLQNLIATFVGKVLAAQKANASGDRDESAASMLSRLGEARRMRTSGFVAYHLEGELWSRTPTHSAKQPEDGFTVAAFEDQEEVDALCHTYQQADAEGRRLIRLVAELSVKSPRP